MFKKMLSKVGMGGAKVDTILKDLPVVRGDVLRGEIQIEGGKVEQQVEQVYLELTTSYTYEDEEGQLRTASVILHRMNIAESFELFPRELKTFPFALEVPLVTPITVGKPITYLRTGLDVKGSVDPKDRDAVAVAPEPATEKLLRAIEGLDFVHEADSGDCIDMETPSGVPYVQSFVYRAQGEMVRRIQALEVLVLPWEAETEFELELELSSGSFGFGREEVRKVNFTLAHETEFGTEELLEILEEAMAA
jgi:sporulation-control protein